MNNKLVKVITPILVGDDNIIFAYIFGSVPKKNAHFGSDLDIAIYFNIEPTLDQIGMLSLKLEETLKTKIDLIQLNKLDKLNPVLAYSIVSEGILLVNNNADLLNEYKKSVVLQYLDFKPTNDFINKSFSYRLSNNRFAVFEK